MQANQKLLNNKANPTEESNKLEKLCIPCLMPNLSYAISMTAVCALNLGNTVVCGSLQLLLRLW